MPSLSSAPSSSSPLEHDPSSVWLKVPTDPTLNVAVQITKRSPLSRGRARSILYPLGRADPVVVDDVRRKRTGAIAVLAEDQAARAALDAILDAEPTVTVLVSWPAEVAGETGELLYVRFLDDTTSPFTLRRHSEREVDLPFVEVLEP